MEPIKVLAIPAIIVLIIFVLVKLFKKNRDAKSSAKKAVGIIDYKHFKHILDSVDDIIYSSNIDGLFTYTNAAVENILGYSKEEIIGLHFQELIHESDSDRIQQAYYQHFKNKLKQSNHEFLVRRKDGTTLWVEQKVTSIFSKDDPKRIVGFYGVVRDINVKKEAVLQLSKEEKTLRQITETLNDVFYLFNVETNTYEYISLNSENILGAKTQVFYEVNDYINSLIHPEDIEISDNAQLALRKGKSYNIDFRIIVNDKVKWINEKSFPIFDDEKKVVAHTGILRDISELKKAQEIIDIQTNEINASIQYAKRIQDAVLPQSEYFSNIFSDAFVFFKPKDVVSGDFYIVDKLKSNDDTELSAFIVADCTGHGVPGAVLSLMCNVLVRESFTRFEINSPAEALDFVRTRLIAFLCTQQSYVINDGMDIAFCVLNRKSKQLYFSGAHISCFVVSNNEVCEYKGNRHHVGYTTKIESFNNYEIDVANGDTVYLFTDGFSDQFGGEKNKKYSKKRLLEFLTKNNHLPMKSIETLLEKEFSSWKKDFFQIDDVTVLGIRINSL